MDDKLGIVERRLKEIEPEIKSLQGAHDRYCQLVEEAEGLRWSIQHSLMKSLSEQTGFKYHKYWRGYPDRDDLVTFVSLDQAENLVKSLNWFVSQENERVLVVYSLNWSEEGKYKIIPSRTYDHLGKLSAVYTFTKE